MFKLILIITLMGFGKNSSAPITVASSQEGYDNFKSLYNCQKAARLILADKKFDDPAFKKLYVSRQAFV